MNRASDHTGASGLLGRFFGSWKMALGELVIVALGVLIALWADQAMHAREEAAMAVSYLERLRTDIRADIEALQFSSNQARNRLEITRRVDAWIDDQQMVDLEITDRKISLRPGDIELSVPLGLASFQTRAMYRNIVWRNLVENE